MLIRRFWEVLKVLEHAPSRDRCYAERAFLRELEGGCQVPIGVNTAIRGWYPNFNGYGG
jgi:porphobilinogen deaminase